MQVRQNHHSALALGLLLLFVVAWLWPIGIGGQVPLGGDITQFFLGLFSVFRERIRQGQLPYWNDRWGFGFPGIAESQMGVYYPPHWLLYGLLSVEAGFAWSLVIHTVWGAIGMWWCARRFGVTPWGSLVAALAFSCGGFFAIHRVHPWAATCGSWMPWAVGLAWGLLERQGRTLTGFLALSAVLAIQLLPGHFQIAFITQVSILLLVCWRVLESLTLRLSQYLGSVSRREDEPRNPTAAAIPLPIGATITVASSVAFGFILAAAQIVPTWRLAERCALDRDFDYLSAFAVPPFHFITYLTPRLFHVSPLWRSLVWDPFHAMPEEHAGYVGLVAFGFALWAILRRVRLDHRVRALLVVAIVSVICSLGPFTGLFDQLVRLPGFSFFRAPSRWGIATALALALLSGVGFDALRDWRRERPWCLLFLFATVTLTTLVVVCIDRLIIESEGPSPGLISKTLEPLRVLMPWHDAPSLATVLDSVHRTTGNPIVQSALLRRGIDPSVATLAATRHPIYFEELIPSAAVAIAIFIALLAARRTSVVRALLVAILMADLWWNAQERQFVIAPARPLATQSELLAFFAKLPRGTRAIDGFGNLPLVAGLAPIRCYRTLDLPVAERQVNSALAPLRFPGAYNEAAKSMEFLGIRVRTLDPMEWSLSSLAGTPPPNFREIQDPALAEWLYGPHLARFMGAGATTFAVWTPLEDTTLSIAHVGPATRPKGYAPVPVRWLSPEHFEIDLPARHNGDLIIQVLYDPQWHASGVDGRGQTRPIEVSPIADEPTNGSWIRIELPPSEPQTVRLTYVPTLERFGRQISLFGWLAWLGTLAIGILLGRRRTNPPRTGSASP